MWRKLFRLTCVGGWSPLSRKALPAIQDRGVLVDSPGAAGGTRKSLEPYKRGGSIRSNRIDAHRELILEWINERPELTLTEISERLDATICYRSLPSIICRFFLRHGVMRKRDGACHRTGAR